MKTLLLLISTASILGGCGAANAYYRVVGPAEMTLGGTTFTPGVNFSVEEGGQILLGPDLPDYYIVEPEVEAEPN